MTTDSLHFNTDDITVALVHRVLAAQFPQWAHLPIVPAVPQGWDNRTFRVGDDLSVRLPSAAGYALQVDKEHRWLPALAPHLPLPIPVPLAKGVPSEIYPFPWSVYRWLDGVAASHECIHDMQIFAKSLAHFLVALQRIDATDGPAPGPHTAFRGGPLITYDADTRRAIVALHGAIDAKAASAVWDAALAQPHQGPAVWFHGDVATSNLLTQDGRLHAVIDFGCAGVGDPACDLTIAWTLFTDASRAAFAAALPLDAATWARAQGWTLWSALITLVAYRATDPQKAAHARRVIANVLAEAQNAA